MSSNSVRHSAEKRSFRLARAALKVVSESEAFQANIDCAVRLDSRRVLLVGWLLDADNEFECFVSMRPMKRLLGKFLEASPLVPCHDGVFMQRSCRPDVAALAGAPDDESAMHGFALFLDDFPEGQVLGIKGADGQILRLGISKFEDLASLMISLAPSMGHSGKAVWEVLQAGLGEHHPATQAVRGGITEPVVESSSAIDENRQLPRSIDDENSLIAVIDHAYSINQAGILVMGWMLSPRRKPTDVLLCQGDGRCTSVLSLMFRLLRDDVVSSFAGRFANVDPRSGFVFFVPVPISSGSDCYLRVCFEHESDVLIGLDVRTPPLEGVALIKHLLEKVKRSGRLQHELFDLFDTALGPAFEAIYGEGPSFLGDARVRQFGVPPSAPHTSIIVPLYGRCDFMRFQLAQFADDEYLQQQDLIYVVDDPGILEDVHMIGANYQALFGVPFRVVWYEGNLGYAAANNVGASYARGQKLLLLNSDVFPSQRGWLEPLVRALDTLPQAGAVAPLLLYEDGSVQHAGMYPLRAELFPGFLLNTHPGQGHRWSGHEEPEEHPLLTAACLLVNLAEFRELGGFDEGYVIGDFEDSDLCLALRKRNKRLYLVPEAKLWHLERQSQLVGQVAEIRQLITLYNGWRYQKKVKTGELADPETDQ